MISEGVTRPIAIPAIPLAPRPINYDPVRKAIETTYSLSPPHSIFKIKYLARRV
jgi:hypothetical protein